MKKLMALLFLLSYMAIPVFAIEFDVSVDEEIKKKYNTSKIETDLLPPLPKVDEYSNNKKNNTNTVNSAVPKSSLNYSNTQNVIITKVSENDGFKVNRGTKFLTRSNLAISDWQARGTKVSFITKNSFSNKHVTIPAGAKFNGQIVKSHSPQITGNGGLVVIKLDSVSYAGKNYSVDGKITKANSKKIFFNNIKGERKYWDNVAKRIDASEKFYAKTKQKSNQLANNPVFMIFSPIPKVVGFVACGVGTVISPVTAISKKGSHISIPVGSEFEIKLVNKTYVK